MNDTTGQSGTDKSKDVAQGAVSSIGLFVVLLFLTVAVIALGGQMLWIAWQQWHTETYLTTTGTVLRHEIRIVPHQKSGPSYVPKIRYSYQVNGTAWESDVDIPGSDRWQYPTEADARLKLNEMPIGSEVTVYFDPTAPRCAALYQGVHPATFAAFVLLGAFQILPVIGWSLWLRRWRFTADSLEPPGGTRIEHVGNSETLVIYPMAPWMAGIVGGAVVAAVVGLIMMGLVSRFSLTIPRLLPLTALIPAAFVWVYYFTIRWSTRIEIDATRQTATVSIPKKRPVRFRLQMVDSVTLNWITKGQGRSVHTTYQAIVELRETDAPSNCITIPLPSTPMMADLDRLEAEWIVSWLERKLVTHGPLSA